MHDVGRFLNRLLGLPPEIQNSYLSYLSAFWMFWFKMHTRKDILTLELLIYERMLLRQGPPKIVHLDHLSGASTVLFTVTLDRGITWESATRLLEEKRKSGLDSTHDGFYESKREWMGKNHFLLAYDGLGSHPTGLTNDLLKLFEPQPPVAYKPPPEKIKSPPYTGIAQFVSKFAEPGDPEYAPPVKKAETLVCS